METLNKFIVGAMADQIVIMNPPRAPISREDALLLAAWLVAIADPIEDDFHAILNAVKDT